MEAFVNGVVILVFLANVALMGYIAFLALKIKNGPVANVTGRIKPMVAKGKSIADTGKREVDQNKGRLHATTGELKAIADTVRPGADGAASKSQFSYRTLLTFVSLLGTVRRGLAQIQNARKPGSNPPGPPRSRKKAPRRLLGALPEIVRLFVDVRRALR